MRTSTTPALMSVNVSVQMAHDALLAMPEVSAVRHSCPLCTAGTYDSAKEGASMPETAQNVYTEAQHFALLTSAVERETASLSEEKQSPATQVETLTSEKAALADQLAQAKSRLDVVDAEKAAAEAKAEVAAKEFADYKTELARQGEIAELKSTRVERVKSANDSLSPDYFTEERAQRWAEMSDEGFEALVADLSEAAAAAVKKEICACGGKDKNCASCKKQDGACGDKKAETARESAAFTGGQTATATDGESTLAQLLARRRGATA